MSTHLAQQATAEILARVEQVSGHPVILVRDTTLTTLATVKPATRQQPSHIVRYRDDPAPAAYQIAFECGFLLRLFALPPAERVQLIGTAAARQTVARDLRQLRADLGSPTVEHVTDLIYDGLMLQLRSCGPGIEVDSRLFAQYPALRELQAATMTQQAHTNAATLNPDLDRQFPRTVVQASRAMNSAYALFAAELLGRPHLAVPYQSAGLEPVGRELLAALFTDSGAAGTPDRQIITAWAHTLGLSGWYDWVPLAEAAP